MIQTTYLIVGILLLSVVNAEKDPSHPPAPTVGEAELTEDGIRFLITDGEWSSNLKTHYTLYPSARPVLKSDRKEVEDGEIYIKDCGIDGFSIYSIDAEGRESSTEYFLSEVDLMCRPAPVLEKIWDDVKGLTVKVIKPEPDQNLTFSFVSHNSAGQVFAVGNKEGVATITDCRGDFLGVYYSGGLYSRSSAVDFRDYPLGKPLMAERVAKTASPTGLHVEILPKLPSGALTHYEYKLGTQGFDESVAPLPVTDNQIDLDCSSKLLAIYTVNKCGRRSMPMFAVLDECRLTLCLTSGS